MDTTAGLAVSTGSRSRAEPRGTREPQLCRLVPWLLGHVVIENKTAAQVTRREKTSLTSVLSDRGLRFGGAGGSCTRTVRIKSPLCWLLNTTAPKLVRAPGIAPGTADWRTATLLLRHARTCKLGPCRAWAAGWLHTDPRGQSGLRSRIENRRFLKENGRPDGSRTRIPRLERPGS